MERLSLEAYLLAKPGAAVDTPFGPGVFVYKVAGKMFALHGEPVRGVSLKCDPYLSEILRGEHSAITTGYHLDKRHWISVAFDGSLDDDFVHGLIDQSYDLVRAKLTRAQKAALEASPN